MDRNPLEWDVSYTTGLDRRIMHSQGFPFAVRSYNGTADARNVSDVQPSSLMIDDGNSLATNWAIEQGLVEERPGVMDLLRPDWGWLVDGRPIVAQVIARLNVEYNVILVTTDGSYRMAFFAEDEDARWIGVTSRGFLCWFRPNDCRLANRRAAPCEAGTTDDMGRLLSWNPFRDDDGPGDVEDDEYDPAEWFDVRDPEVMRALFQREHHYLSTAGSGSFKSEPINDNMEAAGHEDAVAQPDAGPATESVVALAPFATTFTDAAPPFFNVPALGASESGDDVRIPIDPGDGNAPCLQPPELMALDPVATVTAPESQAEASPALGLSASCAASGSAILGDHGENDEGEFAAIAPNEQIPDPASSCHAPASDDAVNSFRPPPGLVPVTEKAAYGPSVAGVASTRQGAFEPARVEPQTKSDMKGATLRWGVVPLQVDRHMVSNIAARRNFDSGSRSAKKQTLLWAAGVPHTSNGQVIIQARRRCPFADIHHFSTALPGENANSTLGLIVLLPEALPDFPAGGTASVSPAQEFGLMFRHVAFWFRSPLGRAYTNCAFGGNSIDTATIAFEEPMGYASPNLRSQQAGAAAVSWHSGPTSSDGITITIVPTHAKGAYVGDAEVQRRVGAAMTALSMAHVRNLLAFNAWHTPQLGMTTATTAAFNAMHAKGWSRSFYQMAVSIPRQAEVILPHKRATFAEFEFEPHESPPKPIMPIGGGASEALNSLAKIKLAQKRLQQEREEGS